MGEKRSVNISNEIIKIINSNDKIAQKQEKILEYHEYEIAKALDLMNSDLRVMLYELLPNKILSAVFSELDPEDAFYIIENTNLNYTYRIFSEMEVDDLADIIDYCEDEEDKITYLSLIPVNKRNFVRKILNYTDLVVGSIMNNVWIEVNPEMTVKQAIKKIVKEAPENEFINDVYVVANDKLVGVISLKELISAANQENQLIKDIMIENLIYVYPSTKNEKAIALMQNYDFQLLPVVDKYQKLIGVVTFDDMIDTLNYELEKDYSSLAGIKEVSIDERETVLETIKKRIPWLIVLLFMSLITSSIIASFQDVLLVLPALFIFMPMISSMAGNSGTQSLGIVIRLFAKNELDNKKAISKHLINETLTGLVNGLIIATILFIIVIIFNLFKGVEILEGIEFALVVAISISIALIVSTVSGTVIPLFIKLIKQDPAVASGPFISTINDILSLTIYFTLARILINTLL